MMAESSTEQVTAGVTRRLPAVLAILAAGLLGEFGFALLLLPLLQHYLVFDRRLAVGLPGYILSAYGVSRLLAQIPLGGLAETMDRRVAVIAGYSAALLAGLALWAPLPVWALLLLAVVFGLGHALADPLIPAALAEGVDVAAHGRALGALNLCQVAGVAAGLVGGAFVADLAPAAAGFLLVAAANGLTLLLLAADAAPLLQRAAGVRQTGSLLAGMRGALSDERVIHLLGVVFVLTLAANLLLPDLSLFSVRRLHTSLHVLTLYLIPASLAGVAALPLGGWLSDRYGRLPPLIGGAGMGAFALALLANVRTPWQAGVVAIFGAAGLALTMPASNAALLDVADPRYRALLLSGMMAVQGFAEAAGPLLSGFLTQISGAVLPIVAASIALWLAVPWSVIFASTPHGDEPGRVVPYTPLTRFISRAHIRAHASTNGRSPAPIPPAQRESEPKPETIEEDQHQPG